MISENEPSPDGQRFISLLLETRVNVDTATAAHHLSRRPQTLRVWASRGEGALQPIRVNGRLAWSVAELKKLLGVHNG
jgi:hypothetical protein